VAHSPLLWGCAASFAFYAPLHSGKWNSPFLMRYFAGHVVEHVATTLFFVGLAALLIKALDVAAQNKLLSSNLLDASPSGGQPVEHSQALIERLARQPAGLQDAYLIRRLREALEYVHRKRSAETLDEELRSLADVDVARMHATYALVRIIVWAIPILGLLGTVIGITAAVANLSPQLLESSITKVTAGLGVAFDHTALALGLSMGLMFSQFLVERYETLLLSAVDARASAELVGRFATGSARAGTDGASLRQIADALIRTMQLLVERQTELWQATIDKAHGRWSELSGATGKQLETALSSALGQSLELHAARVVQSEQVMAEQNRRQWAEVQNALVHNAQSLTAHQRELARQGEVMLQVLQATGDITRLETELNRNLEALAGSRNFEQTVMSLAAAIHLLNGRLGALPADAPKVELGTSRTRGKAA